MLKVLRTYGIGSLQGKVGPPPMLGGWLASLEQLDHYILPERRILSTRIIQLQVIGEQREGFTNRVEIGNVELRKIDTEPDILLCVVIRREGFMGLDTYIDG